MHVIDAAAQTVDQYPGGAESLAPRIGMSAGILRNKVNANNTTNHLSLAEANRIMSVTGDFRILQAMAQEHGFAENRCGGHAAEVVAVAGLVDHHADDDARCLTRSTGYLFMSGACAAMV